MDFDLAFRFHFCIEWVNAKKVTLNIERGLKSTKIFFGIDDDMMEFNDVNIFCLFIEGMMKSEKWKVECKG